MHGSHRWAIVLLFAGLAAPLQAARQPDKPVTDDRVSAKDVALTPAQDLNLHKDRIPALLLTAQTQPYSLAGLDRCPAISEAIREFDSVLGPDVDRPADEKNRLTAGRVAQAAVTAFIPFRGLIREVSGANEQQRRMQGAIAAGIARRAYLKGYAEAKGCNSPQRMAQGIPDPVFVSQPMVQKIN